jgi:flagellar basal body-associated protein FliL
MAEKPKKEPEAAPPAKKEEAPKEHGKAAGGGGGGFLTKLPVLLGGVMLIEAVVLFAGFKFIGGGSPRAAIGAELAAEKSAPAGGDAKGGEGEKSGATGAAADPKSSVEISVVDFRAPNKMSGRTFLYDVSIYVVTKAEYEEKVKATISSRDALIKDRIRTIIAQSDPEKLGGGSEPGLETLRRQVKYQLDEIVGEGLISEVLVPRCIPFRTDY